MTERRLPAGRTPWDPLNGLRVGAFAGVSLGAVVFALTGFGNIWLALGLAAAGAIIGYVTEARRLR